MVDQLLGTLAILVLVLCYLLMVQALMAAVLVLARFIADQARHLLAQLPPVPNADPPTSPAYRLGGGIRKW